MSIEEYFDTLLKTAVERGASDIHINSGGGQFRINGTIVPAELGEALKPADTAMIAAKVLIQYGAYNRRRQDDHANRLLFRSER